MNTPSYSRIVSSSNTDKHGNMKLFSALQWMQDCSVIDFMEDSDFCEWLQANHVTPLVNFRQIEVVRVPVLREKLTCSTHVFDLQGAFGYRNTAFMMLRVMRAIRAGALPPLPIWKPGA